MDLERIVLDRLVDKYASINTPDQARTHLDAMVNSEFLLELSQALQELLQPHV